MALIASVSAGPAGGRGDKRAVVEQYRRARTGVLRYGRGSHGHAGNRQDNATRDVHNFPRAELAGTNAVRAQTVAGT